METKKISAADRPLVFIDTETTGLIAGFHEIIEIAAVRVTPWGERVGMFSTKTVPNHLDRATEDALRINGYTPEGWANAVPLRFALERFAWICSGPIAPIIGGHNPRFDLEFVAESFAEQGMLAPALHHHIIDTSTLAWPLCVVGRLDSLSLGPVCDLHGVSNVGAHGALTDVERTIAVYSKMVPWRDRGAVAPECRDLKFGYAA